MDATLLPPDGRRRWFFEPQIGLLALLVFGIYFTRLADLTLRGEKRAGPGWRSRCSKRAISLSLASKAGCSPIGRRWAIG